MDMARQSEASKAMPGPVPVLLTRPEAEAQAFATVLVQRYGTRVRPVVAPLMLAHYLAPPLPPGPFAGVIFTSVTGVEAARRLGADLPDLAWCVGRKTAERAASAGFRAQSADGDAMALVAAIRADPPNGRLLHLRGENAWGTVAESLVLAGIETESLVVYFQAGQPLPAQAGALLQGEGPMIVPLFSPRSAALFAAALPNDLRAALWLVVMSEAVALAAKTIPSKALFVAERPDAQAMLKAVGVALAAMSAP